MKHQRATSSFASSLSSNSIPLCFLPPTILLLLLLTNASYFVSGNDEDDAGSPGYCRLCERHTMCLFPFDDVGPTCIDVESGDLDAEEIRSIVHQHNVHRNNIAKGLETRGNPGPQPPGRNIMELTWDEELARIARRWALQCNPFRKDYCRDVERFHVWQNMNILSLDSTNEGILEDSEEHPDPGSGIEEVVNASATASPFMRLRLHVQSWLDEVEHFDTAKVGLVDFSMENETSYVAIACAMITRVGCGRATYRTYLDEVEVSSVPSEATDNKNDSGGSRLEVLVCNYGPIDPTTPQNLYEFGTLEFCPQGSLPSGQYDHLCAPRRDVGGILPGEKEYRVDKDGKPDSRWHGIVGSPEWHEENTIEEASRSSAVSIALRKTGDACSRFHTLLQILKLVLFYIRRLLANENELRKFLHLSPYCVTISVLLLALIIFTYSFASGNVIDSNEKVFRGLQSETNEKMPRKESVLNIRPAYNCIHKHLRQIDVFQEKARRLLCKERLQLDIVNSRMSCIMGLLQPESQSQWRNTRSPKVFFRSINPEGLKGDVREK